METIKVVFAILMIQNGSTIEMVPTEGLSDCLKQKRLITRQIGEEQDGIYMQWYIFFLSTKRTAHSKKTTQKN